jgi:aminoglycoside phosphotransferase (APT) family kinase protein
MPELLTFVDEAAVMKVLGQEVPDLHVQSIAFHHAYQDRCVVEINDSLILKFPLREETGEWMAREHWVLNALQGRISIATPTPVFVAQQVFCYGYQKVPGILLTDEHYWALTTRQKQHLALAIAHFLSELHGLLDVVEAAAAGLRPPDDPLSSWQLRQRLLPLLEQSQYVSLVEQILDRYQQIESISKHEVVLHGDLHGWNIALDPATNQLVGVFDFNGTCIGDPHLDFRYFFYTDPPLLESVLAHYQAMSTRTLSLTRCILYAAATDLSDLVYCAEEQRPLYEGPLAARLARLEHQLHSYHLL